MLGKVEEKRKRQWQSMRWLDSITNSMDMTLSKLKQKLEDRRAQPMGSQRVDNVSQSPRRVYMSLAH